LTVEHLNIIH